MEVGHLNLVYIYHDGWYYHPKSVTLKVIHQSQSFKAHTLHSALSSALSLPRCIALAS